MSKLSCFIILGILMFGGCLKHDLPKREKSVFDYIEITSEDPEKLVECRRILLLTDKIGKTLNAEYIQNYGMVDIAIYEIESGKVLNSQCVVYYKSYSSNLDIYSYEGEKVRFNIDNFTTIEINIDFRTLSTLEELREDEEYKKFNRLVEELKEITDTYEENDKGNNRLWITMKKKFSRRGSNV